MRTRVLVWMLGVFLSLGLASQTQAAWYIGPAGGISGSAACSDSANGSRATPFCTFERAKTAMAGSGDKQTYLRGQPTTGTTTYVRTANYTFNAGENWATDPLDLPRSAVIDASTGTMAATMSCFGSGCNNISVRNLTFERGPNHLNTNDDCANLTMSDAAHDIYIENNRFQGSLRWDTPGSDSPPVCKHILTINTSLLFIRGNTFIDSARAMGQAMYWGTSQTANYHDLYVTDNIFDGCSRFCVEIQSTSALTGMDHFHLDRNTFINSADPTNTKRNGRYMAGASLPMNAAHTVISTNSTIWGNTFTEANAAGSHDYWGIEDNWSGATVSQNTFNFMPIAIELLFATSSVIENNTITLRTSGMTGAGCSGGAACAYTNDTGVYDHSEWIGTNSINGTNVTGCTTTGSTGFCRMAPQTYGTKPSTYAPSAPFGDTIAPAAPTNLRVVSP